MLKYNYDLNDIIRRARRIFDGKLTYRKIFVIIVVSCLFFLWILTQFFFGGNDKNKAPYKGSFSTCFDEILTPRILQKIEDGDMNIIGNGLDDMGIQDIAYVGNGLFGIDISQDSYFYIRDGRALTQKVPFIPIVSVLKNMENSREFSLVDYVNGIVVKNHCYNNFHVSSQYYAHRNYPSIFVQEISITSYRNQLIDLSLILPKALGDFEASSVQGIKIQQDSKVVDCQVVSGYVRNASGKIRVVAFVYQNIPRILKIQKRGTTKLNILMSINYSKEVAKEMFGKTKETVESAAIEELKKVIEFGSSESIENFHNSHTKIWNNLWQTGLYISTSKAENSLNGNKINSTIYHVLSHSRSYEFEDSITPQRKNQIAHDTANFAEGCFDHYHTLAAENLWKTIYNINDANLLVQTWMLTLEKQGCHNLIRAGASGIIQSMVLSFGSFRFSNQHLELNIHPQYLHRDFTFRRINYGNMTHLNVSIHVRDDNKAELEVALDRSDRKYYACDAGCIDPVVQLGPEKKIFPVKLTEPLTSILYITAEKQHIDDLKHAIHVKEIVEAPAHEHHVIFLHKHGGNLGGLPTLFWIAICAIIIIFHVFLCKLIVKEYCEPPEIRRYRYSKP